MFKNKTEPCAKNKNNNSDFNLSEDDLEKDEDIAQKEKAKCTRTKTVPRVKKSAKTSKASSLTNTENDVVLVEDSNNSMASNSGKRKSADRACKKPILVQEEDEENPLAEEVQAKISKK